ncbi:MAG: PocR ligand-binding domain-containing protein [Acidobacteriota bacterium]
MNGGDTPKDEIRVLLSRVAEAVSLSWAIYEPGNAWPVAYADASREALCGFARRASITSGRCRDEEGRMAERAIESGQVQRGTCWQGTMRWVFPMSVAGQVVMAVAICGFGVDPEAQATDYLPQDIAEALGLPTGVDRSSAFPRDSVAAPQGAAMVAAVLEKALQALLVSRGF